MLLLRSKLALTHVECLLLLLLYKIKNTKGRDNFVDVEYLAMTSREKLPFAFVRVEGLWMHDNNSTF